MRATSACTLAVACALATTALGCLPAEPDSPALRTSTPDAASSGTETATAPPLADVATWVFAIGAELRDDTLERCATYDLVVLDAEDATSDDVAFLHEHGVLVLGYLSVGTIEDWRSWYAEVKPYRLEHWDEWDEWYADVSDATYREIIAGEVAPRLLAKGFDGLFLDNVDMIETHPELAEGMRALVSTLAGLVHGQNGYLFAQNGESVMAPLVPYLDGWNREDVTFTYDFDTGTYVRVPAEEHAAALAALAVMRERGLVVLATDYVEDADGAEASEAARLAESVGALPYASDIELRHIAAAR